jgi:osmotically inducible lipoprotein OsmB
MTGLSSYAFRSPHSCHAGSANRSETLPDQQLQEISAMAKTKTLTLGAMAILTLALAGCGSDPLTRGATGGLLGAGAGAGVAAVTGGKPATGALIGGGVGAVGGALTAH